MVTESNSDKGLIIEDANIAAFLSMKGFQVSPFIKDRGPKDSPVVAWDVHGEKIDVEESVQSFYGNEEVGVNDFVKSLREIRGAMYNLKSISSQ